MRYQYLSRSLYRRYALICLTIILSITCAQAQAQNKAEFTADNWTGCGTAYVQFTNQSTPAGGTASWDFGDGGAKATLWNPARSFTKTGTYPVTLTVTFPNG